MTRHQSVGGSDPVSNGAVAPEANGSRAVERALMLLSLVGRGGDGGVTLACVVAGRGMTEAMTRRLLLALIEGGLVEQVGASRRYLLEAETFVPGQMARRYDRPVQAAGAPRHLCEAMEDTSSTRDIAA